ncbi:MAG: DUF192 domain-containing protein [Planctomycetota bacterium]
MQIKNRLFKFALIPFAVIIIIIWLKPAPSSSPSPDFILRINRSELKLELAFTEETRRKGLMHRPALPPDTGLLFIYPDEQGLSFWMKNTEIPLDIAFIKADGTITQISPLKPFDTTSVVSRDKTKYALEVNRGWFTQHRVKTGDRVAFPAYVKNIIAE